MSSQLDILALEPFYGGVRKAMLETVVRCSRHRWTVLKLPPRRIERRLTAAANWFAEQLSRHWAGRVDVLFTSEAMNLANLYRLVPALTQNPSVVYFHGNQLPAVNAQSDDPIHLVNLNTATAATEIWFNSLYHVEDFFSRAAAMVGRHRELSARNPIPDLTERVLRMPPPIDTGLAALVRAEEKIERDPNAIFVETRDADVRLLNEGLARLRERGEDFRLITVGPVEELSADWPRTTIPENDLVGHVRGMLAAGVFVSVKPSAPCDFLAVNAMAAGCRPVLPSGGVYPELLPDSLHEQCLYEVAPQTLAARLGRAISPSRPNWNPESVRPALRPFDPIPACRAIDERLEQLVAAAHAQRA